jgi:hypothetical protein
VIRRPSTPEIIHFNTATVVGISPAPNPWPLLTKESSESSFGIVFGITDGRYHGVDDALYPLPNDDLEINRLDELHYCVQGIMGGKNILPK